MVRKARVWIGLAVAAMSSGAVGSGGPAPQPVYVAAEPRNAAEWRAFTGGRPGIVKTATTDALLYAQWRVLNRLALDEAAIDALAKPCCGSPGDGTYTWIAARRGIPNVSELYFISTEREGPNYTAIPTCFDDAFVTAAATLEDRVRRFGKDAPAVRQWVATQDAVFAACARPGVTLPPLAADVPQWLRADRAYQEAALALYDDRTDEAAARFAAIARDRRSPWRPLGLYLHARALQRAARVQPTPARFAAAQAAIARVAAAPACTYGRGEVARMRQVLEFRANPAGLLARLDRELAASTPAANVAVAFRDYMTLSDRAEVKPDAADWIRTMRPKDRVAALEHARQRWQANGKVPWLVAALSLAEPGDAAGLLRDGERIGGSDPAWLSVRYHLLRLTMASVDPAAIRAQVDAILAREDLSRSDRNVFRAIRTQRATSLSDLVRHGLRQPNCDAASDACVDGSPLYGDGLLAKQADGFVGFGVDARVIIDLLPLAARVTLAADPTMPAPLRLDIALTSYARAVQLQDIAAIDRVVMLLVDLLPQLAPDWRRIAATRPGPDKRFAEFFVMAKIPSLRVDLADHERPIGTVREFSGYWIDWMLLPRGAAAPSVLPKLAGAQLPTAILGETEAPSDLTCLERCGGGGFPLHLPAFVAATLPQMRAERSRFVTANAAAPGATSLWDEMLTYARAHPNDPRTPEALYRLIRVARWGGNHNHLGRRAFRLLHDRYPGSPWTKQSPYFYDD